MTVTSTAAVFALYVTGTVLVLPTENHFLVTNGVNAWAHGNAADAFKDAQWLSKNTGKRIASFAKRKSGDD